MSKLFEGSEKVTSPYDFSKEYIIYTNPSRSQLKHLVKNRPAIRGLVFDDGRTFVVVDAMKADHHMLKYNLVYDMGFNEDAVEDAYEIFFTNLVSKEGEEYDVKTKLGDMYVFCRSVQLGGMPLKRLIRSNIGLAVALGDLVESQRQQYFDMLMEQELLEATLGQRIAAIAASVGLMTAHAAPLASLARGGSAREAVSNQTNIVIDPETFERWMTEPSHDQREHSSMQRDREAQQAQEEYEMNALMQTEDFLYLSLTMWGEARSHGEMGMRAVGHVIMNRVAVDANMFGGNTISGVALKDRQFSCWNQGDPNRERMLNIDRINPETPDGRAWQLAQAIAVQILMGNSEDPTSGATMYHAARVNPFWANDDRNQEVARIADHIFYVDTRWG